MFRASRALMEKAEDAGSIELTAVFPSQPILGFYPLPRVPPATWQKQRVYASALQYAKRALALASTGEQKVLALMRIAKYTLMNELYADARSYLSQALKIDDCNVQVIGTMAGCYAAEGNGQEAVRLAKRGLMLDPDNVVCKWYAEQSPSTISSWGASYWIWPP